MSTNDEFARFATTHLSDPSELSPDDGRISFGPKEWQSLTPEVASMVLTLWRERSPATFGAYLAEVMTGTKLSGREAKS